jgi:uncharacterized membrane protein
MKQKLTITIILTVLSILALKDLFATSFLPLFHDQVQSERVSEMKLALDSGQFPVRFVGNLGYGYGYPIFNYYAPLPYYFGAALNVVLDLILSTKLLFVFAFIISGFSMYYVSSRIWGRAGGLISAILYLLAPYHAVQLYVRGSLGEMFAYALIPFILWTVIKISTKTYAKNIYLVLATAALFISHTISAYIVLLYLSILFIILLIKSVKQKNYSSLLQNSDYYILFPVLLSSFFLLPAFFEINQTQLSLQSANDVKYSDHFITIAQLWSSAWGYAGSAPGTTTDGMSFMIGKITIILSIIVLIITLIKSKIKSFNISTFQYRTLVLLSITSLITIFLTTSYSDFIWKTIPYMQLIQFPWRFLTLINLFLSLIAGASILLVPTVLKYFKLNSPKYRYSLITLILVIISYTQLFSLNLSTFPTSKYFRANGYYQMESSQIISQENLRYNASKISDEYLPKGAVKATDFSQISDDQITCFVKCSIKNALFKPDYYKFEIDLEYGSPVFIQKAYYPNFKATVDNKDSKIELGANNIMGVNIPRGLHTVEFKLQNTFIRTLGNIISIFAVIVLIVYHVTRVQPRKQG